MAQPQPQTGWTSFQQIVWLAPVVLGVHSLELVLNGPAGILRRVSAVVNTEPFSPHVAAQQLYLTMVLSTAIVFAIPWIAMYARKKGPLIYIILGLQALVLVHVLALPIASTVALRAYVPGVVTAALLIVPFSLYLFRRAVREEFISWKGLALALVAGLAGYLPTIALTHIITAIALRIGRG